MADNVAVTPGEGATIATDELEIDGAKAQVQRVKPVIGAAGSGVDVSSANPMPVNDAGGSLTVDGTVAVSALSGELPEGTKALGKVKVSVLEGEPKVKIAELPATPTGTNSIGSVKKIEEAVTLTGEPTVKLTGEPKVKVSSLEGEPNVKVSNEPTIKVAAAQTLATVTTVSTLSTVTGGGKAHDEADGGNPIKTGSKAVTTLPTAVSANDRTDNLSDKYGRQLYSPNPPDRLVSGKALLENETSTEVVAAGGAGVRTMVTSILVTNASTTTSTRVEILDEATSKMIGEAVKSGGGFSLVNPHGIFIGTANKPVKAKCITTGAKVDVFIGGYSMPE